MTEAECVAVPAGDADVLGIVIVVMQAAFVGPNVFICASSFNERARALYARVGSETVGELRDYVVSGESEILMRKSLGLSSEKF